MTTEAHRYINQNSGYDTWVTPPHIIEAARATMGGIDLDPASSDVANEIVQATEYYTEYGLTQMWHGRVWLNWPYSRSNNDHWSRRVTRGFEGGEFEQACVITFASTSEEWCARLLAYPVCFLQPRVAFLRQGPRLNGTGPFGPLSAVHGSPKGSMITYFGGRIAQFRKVFSPFGKVMLPWNTGEW